MPELESLRGLALLLVVAFHVDSFGHVPRQPPATATLPLAFVRAGHTGVDLFFVLSAFLLAQPFLADAAGGRRVVVRDYFARRALRILPLYWVAVVVATVCTSDRVADLLRALPHLAFLSSFPGLAVLMNPWGAVWWSLATEVQFYLLLPLLLLRRVRAGSIVLGLALVAWGVAYVAMVRGVFPVHSMEGQMTLFNSVFGRAPLFLSGIGAAAIHRRWGARLRARLAGVSWLRNGGADCILAGLLVVMGLCLQWVVAIGPNARWGPTGQPWHVANGVLWGAVLLLLLLAPLRTRPLFSNRALARLGILSYSIYLIHAPLVFLPLKYARATYPGTFDGWQPTSAALIAALLVACIGLAELTYRFIERPFLVRKARYDS